MDRSPARLRSLTLLAATAVGLVALAAPSCGGPAKSDCSVTCQAGCCDDKGFCQRGDTRAACGIITGTCVACSATEACFSGACKNVLSDGGLGGGAGGGAGGGGPSCAQSCAGCCDSAGACQLGLSEKNCGNAGATCSACVGSQLCSIASGRCLSASCSGCTGVDGGCQTTLSDRACGNSGVSCIDCAAGSATCQLDAGICKGGCGGCRDAFGVCQTGSTRAACGGGGVTCVACGSTQTCTGGQCVALPSDGGGGAGGGAAAGDGCTSAIAIALTGTMAAINADTTPMSNSHTPSCAASASTAKDMVYQLIAPRSGLLTVTATPSAMFDVNLSAWAGSTCAAATEATQPDSTPACADANSASEAETLSLNVVSGTTYWIWVDGYDSTDLGTFSLSLKLP